MRTWAIIGTAFAAIVFPLTLWLLKGGAGRPDFRLAPEPEPFRGERAAESRWTSRAVLTDVRFQLILPVGIVVPFVASGFLFHGVHVANAKGWSVAWLAACIAGLPGQDGVFSGLGTPHRPVPGQSPAALSSSAPWRAGS